MVRYQPDCRRYPNEEADVAVRIAASDTAYVYHYSVASRQLERGNRAAAVEALQAFANEVEAQEGKVLSDEGYALLKLNASHLINRLNTASSTRTKVHAPASLSLLAMLFVTSMTAAAQSASASLPIIEAGAPALPDVMWKADGPPSGSSRLTEKEASLTEVPADASIVSVPFASANNRIELDIVNSSARPARALRVYPVEQPEWLHLSDAQEDLDIPAGQTVTAVFSYTVDAAAPVGTRSTLRFEAALSDGQAWSRSMRIEVAAPPETRLLGNRGYARRGVPG